MESKFLDTLKSLVKIAVSSRKATITKATRDNRRLIIMANGPSLNDTIEQNLDLLCDSDTMAVNFAANTEVFTQVRPRYYILVDPHFFTADADPNVDSLWRNLAGANWRYTIFVPAKYRRRTARRLKGSYATVEGFNPVGLEGYRWLTHRAFRADLGMPRPRNVLIASIMVAMAIGYKQIYLCGADHSWTKTLSVNERNEVVSIQPHFYADDQKETERVASVYRDVRLHEIIYSFYVAFKSYFEIAAYAREQGVEIFNATPGSFIDAFPRREL